MTLGQAMTPNQNALEDSIPYSHSFHKLIVKSLSYDETHQTPMDEIQIAIIAPWCPIAVKFIVGGAGYSPKTCHS
jgi:hypothetical protein